MPIGFVFHFPLPVVRIVVTRIIVLSLQPRRPLVLAAARSALVVDRSEGLIGLTSTARVF
jgi:hypothetical protein